jgi:hypothetical protein
MPLTDTQIRSAKPGLKPVKPKKGSDDRVVFVATTKPVKLYYTKGLYLEVDPSGGKYWRFKYNWTVPSSRLGSGALVGQAEVG